MDDKRQIKIGDVVRLLSGGPKMVVAGEMQNVFHEDERKLSLVWLTRSPRNGWVLKRAAHVSIRCLRLESEQP